MGNDDPDRKATNHCVISPSYSPHYMKQRQVPKARDLQAACSSLIH